MELMTYVGAVACLMIANTLIVSASKIIERSFDWSVFFKGIGRYLLILIAITFIFTAGWLLPTIEIMEGVTIIEMLKMLGIALAVKYGVSCYKSLMAVFSVSIEDEQPFEVVGEVVDYENVDL